MFAIALEKKHVTGGATLIRLDAQVSGTLPGRAMPLDIDPALVEAIEQYENFQAGFPASAAGPDADAPQASTPTNPDIPHATQPSPSPSQAGGGQMEAAEPVGTPTKPDISDVPAPLPAPSWAAEEPAPYPTTPEGWRTWFKNKIPWWVPLELDGDAVWDWVTGYMAAPIVFRGEEPDGHDPFAAPDDDADDDLTPTKPDISLRAA